MACHERLQGVTWAVVGACTLRLLPAGEPGLHWWLVQSWGQLLRDVLLLGRPRLLRHLQLGRPQCLRQLLLLVCNLVRVQRWGWRTDRRLLHHRHVSSMLHWRQ